MQVNEFDDIKKLLPHGEGVIGISAVIESIDHKVVVLAHVGKSKHLLTSGGFLIPEAMLELIGQAAAIGGNLNSKKLLNGSDAKQGVIARVRSFWVQRDRQFLEKDELTVTVNWTEPVGKVFELQGEVRLSGSNDLVAKADCTVLEMP